MPSRRALLAGLGSACAGSLAGCGTVGGRPDVRLNGGYGTLHPASNLYVANGLQPDGDTRVYVTLTPDESPETVGPDANDELTDRLQNPTDDEESVFHAVVQVRSTPAAPLSLFLEDVRWRGSETLVLDVTVEPWGGSFEDIDDATERQRLQSAEELVYTTVWSVTPALDSLPGNVDLSLRHRELVR